jgi:hypothetical protein
MVDVGSLVLSRTTTSSIRDDILFVWSEMKVAHLAKPVRYELGKSFVIILRNVIWQVPIEILDPYVLPL